MVIAQALARQTCYYQRREGNVGDDVPGRPPNAASGYSMGAQREAPQRKIPAIDQSTRPYVTAKQSRKSKEKARRRRLTPSRRSHVRLYTGQQYQVDQLPAQRPRPHPGYGRGWADRGGGRRRIAERVAPAACGDSLDAVSGPRAISCPARAAACRSCPCRPWPSRFRRLASYRRPGICPCR